MPSRPLLRQILVQIADNRQRGLASLVVFDLDSTLFDVAPRLEKILADFAQDPQFRKSFPSQTELLKQIRIHRQDWGVRDALERLGLGDDHVEFHEAMRDFWRSTFFSHDYLAHDIPYPGAVEFVKSLTLEGADIVYLTGRDVARMGRGSETVLKKWDFPLNEKARLVLKPHQNLDDAEFKTNWFQQLPQDTYGNIWFFENEPVNIHHMRAQKLHDRPPVDVVFFESTHSRRAHAPTDLPSIMHFLLDDDEEKS